MNKEVQKQFIQGYTHAAGRISLAELDSNELEKLAFALHLEKRAGPWGAGIRLVSKGLGALSRSGLVNKATQWALKNPQLATRAATTTGGAAIGAGVGGYKAHKEGRSILEGAAKGGAIGGAVGLAAPTAAHFARRGVGRARDYAKITAERMGSTGVMDEYTAIGKDAIKTGFGKGKRTPIHSKLKEALKAKGIDASKLKPSELKKYVHTGKGGTIYAKVPGAELAKDQGQYSVYGAARRMAGLKDKSWTGGVDTKESIKAALKERWGDAADKLAPAAKHFVNPANEETKTVLQGLKGSFKPNLVAGGGLVGAGVGGYKAYEEGDSVLGGALKGGAVGAATGAAIPAAYSAATSIPGAVGRAVAGKFPKYNQINNKYLARAVGTIKEHPLHMGMTAYDVATAKDKKEALKRAALGTTSLGLSMAAGKVAPMGFAQGLIRDEVIRRGVEGAGGIVGMGPGNPASPEEQQAQVQEQQQEQQRRQYLAQRARR